MWRITLIGTSRWSFENRVAVVAGIHDRRARGDRGEILRDLPAERLERGPRAALTRREQPPGVVFRRRGDDDGADEVVLGDALEEVEGHGSLRSGRFSAAAAQSLHALRLKSIARCHSSRGYESRSAITRISVTVRSSRPSRSAISRSLRPRRSMRWNEFDSARTSSL